MGHKASREAGLKRLGMALASALALFGAAQRDATASPEPEYASADSTSLPAPRESAQEGWKSPGSAFCYSFFGTLIPVGVGVGTALGQNELSAGALVAIGGGIVGPSLGHFYAGRSGRAVRGILIRGAAAAIVALAVTSADDSNKSEGGLAGLAAGASLVGATFLVLDIAGAAHSARVHNRSLAGQTLSVTPVVGLVAGGPGVSVRLTY